MKNPENCIPLADIDVIRVHMCGFKAVNQVERMLQITHICLAFKNLVC